MILILHPDGTAQGRYDDRLPLRSLGPQTIQRASHVEPTPHGQWQADLAPVGGPVLGPYPTRAEALEAEAAWLDVTLVQSTTLLVSHS